MKHRIVFAFLTITLLFSNSALAQKKDLKSATMSMMRASYERLFECFGGLSFCESVDECMKHSNANEVLNNPEVLSGKITAADLEICTKAFRKISCKDLKDSPPQECKEIPPFKK